MRVLIFRVLPLLAACVLAAAAARAQGGAPGLVVLEQGWDRSRPPSPALFEDPLAVAERSARNEASTRETIRQNKVREKSNQEQLPLPVPGAPPAPSGAGRPRCPAPDGYVYNYTARVRNDGGKKVRSIDWDYVVFDAAAGREAGRHSFTSKVSLAPGRTKKLSGKTDRPPSGVVPAEHSERVVIRRVEYDDGTVWEGAPD